MTSFIGDDMVGIIKGTWNPFIVAYTSISPQDAQKQLDPRLALAMVVLLMTIEGKQK